MLQNVKDQLGKAHDTSAT